MGVPETSVTGTAEALAMDCDPTDGDDETLKKVREIMSVAKIDEAEIKPLVQEIHFDDLGKESSTVLMEVPEDLLAKLLEGQRAVFRGEEEDPVVLCSGSSSFEVREAEVSNHLLFVPDLTFPDQTSGSSQEIHVVPARVTVMKQTYLELRSIKPKTKRIKELLSMSLYDGLEKESDVDEESRQLFRTEDLLNTVQASEPELLAALKKMRACQINGFWRLLNPTYELRVLNHFTNFVEENSWAPDEVERDLTILTLKSLEPDEVLEQVFDYFFEPNEDGSGKYRMKADAVSRCMGEMLLRQSEKFDLADFLVAWQESVPAGVRTNLNQLSGVAFVNKTVQPSYVERFSVENLPDGIPERLAVLFKKREKWLLDDIAPFVQDLTTEKMTANALLTKHARATIVSGKKFFCAKHGK